MPVYTVRCPSCGHEEDIFRPLAQYDDLPEHCGQRMERVICAPYVSPDIQPYKSMKTGEMITSRSKHRAHLKQHGLIEIGNEKIENKRPQHPGGIKEELIRQLNR